MPRVHFTLHPEHNGIGRRRYAVVTQTGKSLLGSQALTKRGAKRKAKRLARRSISQTRSQQNAGA